MDFAETVRGRRAIRSFQNRPIPEAELLKLLGMARYAPSSMNGQPWHFILVRDSKKKSKLAEIKNRYCPKEKQAYRADFLVSAPAVIVVCVEKSRSFGREVENALIAATYILLGAHSLGLGSVYLSAYTHGEPALADEIRNELKIPVEIEPISILPLGYANENPPPKELRRVEEILHFDQF